MDAHGGRGYYQDEQPEYVAIRKWAAGQFTEAETALAESWRLSTRKLNYEEWKRGIKKTVTLRSVPALLTFVDFMMDETSVHHVHLGILLDDLGYNERDKSTLVGRWRHFGMPDLRTYAPYTAYCIRVFQAFYFGISQNLISTKSTNRIDIEYILYLPFCRAFTSQDAFLRDFAPHFMRDQTFIFGQELKDDMAKMMSVLNSFSESDRAHYRASFGSYPPGDETSITTRLWLTRFGPRGPQFAPISRDPSKMDEEQEMVKKLWAMTNGAKEELERQRVVTGKPGPEYPRPPPPIK
jgi:hypothetical protein